MSPEFSRPLPTTCIGPSGLDTTIEATPSECDKLAVRLKLPGIGTLSCRFRLHPGPRNSILAESWLTAMITQICVASLDEFEGAVTDYVMVRFIPSGTESTEIDPESPDEIPFTNDTIDLGEAATQQLALALDPWPRKPGATLPGA
jgi:hypothetical protein